MVWEGFSSLNNSMESLEVLEVWEAESPPDALIPTSLTLGQGAIIPSKAAN